MAIGSKVVRLKRGAAAPPRSIHRNWEGPKRNPVPRSAGLKDQASGKVLGTQPLARKVAENRYGGSGWDPSKIAKPS